MGCATHARLQDRQREAPQDPKEVHRCNTARSSKKTHAALRTHQTGGVVPLQRDSLGGYLGRWLDGLHARGRRQTTIDSYRWIVKKHITPELGMKPLTRLTQVDINDFMARKINGGLSPRTVQYCHAIIRSALSKAEKDGLVGRNGEVAEPPARRCGDSRINPLKAEEARQLLGAVDGHRLGALYSVALALGLRRGEALGLEWRGIDLEKGRISITQTVKRVAA